MKHVFLILVCACLIGIAEDMVSHRQAFRARLAQNPSAAVAEGLRDSDAVIRRYCVYQDFLRNGPKTVEGWKKLVSDPDELVQLAVAECLAKLPQENPHRQALGKALVETSKFPAVIRQVSRLDASAFNFYRNNVRLKDGPTYDHIVEIQDSIELPDDRWLMCTDPAETGHTKNWFAPDFDDQAWTPVKCEAWEGQGFPGYDGVAWYRIRFAAPPKGNCVGADLKFGAVDEQAWVWLNGKYIGQHTIGPEGWDVAFWLNIGDEIAWGAENLLVVRVEDSKMAGGIWKPIELQTLISK